MEFIDFLREPDIGKKYKKTRSFDLMEKDNKNNENVRKKATNSPVKEKIKLFFKKNLLVIILILLSAGAIAVNEYDKKNTETINVVVDPKLLTTPLESQQTQEKITIYVYNQDTRAVEEREVIIQRQQNLIEGDYINEIIKNTPFLTENMKFQSAYSLNVDGKNTTIIKLNEAFSGLRVNEELFNGFTQSVANTISKNFPNIQGINIQIDGEAIIQ